MVKNLFVINPRLISINRLTSLFCAFQLHSFKHMLRDAKLLYHFIISVVFLVMCIQQVKSNQDLRERESSPPTHFVRHKWKRDFYPKATAAKMANCDQSSIPLMESFDLLKFSGGWYELAKMSSGYIDLNDGMWSITSSRTTATFVFSGRNSKDYCVGLISGRITTSKTPGELFLHYRTYSTAVSERIRVLYTDYNTIAVVYTCLHFSDHSGSCHPAGVFGSIWTRITHADLTTYNLALSYLNKACIDSHSVHIRSRVGPCRNVNLTSIEDLESAPDICYQDISHGSCSASIRRFYYNSQEKKCEPFTYTGCGRNDNNFMSLLECEKVCVSKYTLTKTPVCEETAKCAVHCPPCCRKVNGCVVCDCENVIVDDFVECLNTPLTCPNKCLPEQVYKDCFICKCEEETSKDHIPGICVEVKEPGQCTTKTKRFYFNVLADTCQEFDYTGCGGNNNNFETLGDCLIECKGYPVWKANPLPDGEPDEARMLQIPLFLIVMTLSFLLAC